ncbi:MAG TPA: hypothetical protein PKA00_07740 [Saprospiraceae bacterium]|nr:hypothetical protein [Saprospiraceae bacterium]HMQ82783.1 hypothetical protein [Saprospiraceae bacterium]
MTKMESYRQDTDILFGTTTYEYNEQGNLSWVASTRLLESRRLEAIPLPSSKKPIPIRDTFLSVYANIEGAEYPLLVGGTSFRFYHYDTLNRVLYVAFSDGIPSTKATLDAQSRKIAEEAYGFNQGVYSKRTLERQYAGDLLIKETLQNSNSHVIDSMSYDKDGRLTSKLRWHRTKEGVTQTHIFYTYSGKQKKTMKYDSDKLVQMAVFTEGDKQTRSVGYDIDEAGRSSIRSIFTSYLDEKGNTIKTIRADYKKTTG